MLKSNESIPGRTDGRPGEPGRHASSVSTFVDKSYNLQLTHQHKNINTEHCHQCAKCTEVTAKRSLELVRCTHGTKCISPVSHYHICPPLCGFARRAAEKRKKAAASASTSTKQADKQPRHYRCRLSATDCPDLDCHFHTGRAPVFKKDCTLRNLAAVTSKNAVEASELWEQLTDAPITTEPSSLSPHAEPFVPQFAHVSPKNSAHQSASEARPRPPGYDEEKHENHSPRSSTTLECGTSPETSDDWTSNTNFSAPSGAPSSEEKKPASAIVTDQAPVMPPTELGGDSKPFDTLHGEATPPLDPTSLGNVPDHGPSLPDPSSQGYDAASCAPAPESSPNDGLELRKYIVFSNHSVRGRRERYSLMTRLMLKLSCAASMDVVLHNEQSDFVSSNVLSLAQKQISVTKYFWQNWDEKSPTITQDSISLFAGTFTHADEAEVFHDLARHLLCHQAFTKMASKLLLDGVALRDTVRLRVLSMIADHPRHSAYSAKQHVLSDTITFVNNQLLLRGLIDEARKPQRIAPAIVDFRKEAVSKTSLSTARRLKSAAKKRMLTRCTNTTVASR